MPATANEILKLTHHDLQNLQRSDPGAVAMTKALMQVRQALFDILGAFPQENILPYGYSFSNTVAKGNAIAANGTASQSIKVSADSAFIATQITGASTGDYLIFPRQDAADRQVVNEAIHSSAFVGTAERPHYLPKPLMLNANTTISFDITDLSGAQNEIYFSLIGYKVYRRA